MAGSGGLDDPLAEGERLNVESGGDPWVVSWHPPAAPPAGKPHGANAFCVTEAGNVVLVSSDGERWGWPGGRPEDGEDWEQVLRREMLQEACAQVLDARLLGFARSECLGGHEDGLTLVRSIWLASVEVLPWEPQFEIPFRRLVPTEELRKHLWTESGFAPFSSAFCSKQPCPEAGPACRFRVQRAMSVRSACDGSEKAFAPNEGRTRPLGVLISGRRLSVRSACEPAIAFRPCETSRLVISAQGR